MGVLKTFKFCKFLLISSVPVTVWWGGKTLSAKNNNTIVKTKTCFSVSRQQQREAPALELNDTVPIKEDGTHLTAGKYSDLINAMY